MMKQVNGLCKRNDQKIGVITQFFCRQKVESFNPGELVEDDRPQNTW